MTIFALKKGDKVVKKITGYIAKQKIKSGVIIGLGAFSEAELMLYDLETKRYFSKKLNGPLEVGNFMGIIGKDPSGKAHIHPHATLTDKEFNTYAGHLKEATVGATLEIVIFESDQTIERYADSEIGLNLIK